MALKDLGPAGTESSQTAGLAAEAVLKGQPLQIIKKKVKQTLKKNGTQWVVEAHRRGHTSQLFCICSLDLPTLAVHCDLPGKVNRIGERFGKSFRKVGES